MNNATAQILTQAVEELSDVKAYKELFHRNTEGTPLPSGTVLAEIVDLARAILFPGFYGNSSVNIDTLQYHIGVNVEHLYCLLVQQIQAGLSFAETDDESSEAERFKENRKLAQEKAEKFVSKLPEIRKVLATDVIAAYNGDPAAKNYGEIVSCYHVIKTLMNYRIAHELLLLEVPLIPRMLTEMAHSETGIDIHPGATIGKYFTIDHGTGVVIGETTIIGDNVKLYQGVTLGAKSFPCDENGNPIKGIPRHPILEDDVIVYSNASILGRITIGKGATIGGNIWVTQDVPAGTFISQKR